MDLHDYSLTIEAMWIWIFMTAIGTALSTSLRAISYNLSEFLEYRGLEESNPRKTIQAGQRDVLGVYWTGLD